MRTSTPCMSIVLAHRQPVRCAELVVKAGVAVGAPIHCDQMNMAAALSNATQHLSERPGASP